MKHDNKSSFQARRAAVLRDHLHKNPEWRAARRARRRGLVLAGLKLIVVAAVIAFAGKSFAVYRAGPDGYRAMVAPVLADRPPDGWAARVLEPDPYSRRAAAVLDSVAPLAQTTAAQR